MSSRRGRDVITLGRPPEDDDSQDCFPRGLGELLAFLFGAFPSFLAVGLILSWMGGIAVALLAAAFFWASPHLCAGILFGSYLGMLVLLSSSANAFQYGLAFTVISTLAVARLSVLPLAKEYFAKNKEGRHAQIQSRSGKKSHSACSKLFGACCGEALIMFFLFLISIAIALVILAGVSIGVFSFSIPLIMYVAKHKVTVENASSLFIPILVGVPMVAGIFIVARNPRKEEETKRN